MKVSFMVQLLVAGATMCVNGEHTSFRAFHLPMWTDDESDRGIRSLLARADSLVPSPAILVETQEDKPIDIVLPSNCSRFFWKNMRGSMISSEAGVPIVSGAHVPTADFCSVTFLPDSHFFGEQLFWYSTQKNQTSQQRDRSPAPETLHAAMIIISPTRDSAEAVDDKLAVDAGEWATVAPLENDVDADLMAMDGFHACTRPTAAVSPNSYSGAWLDVVGLSDAPDVVVTVTLEAGPSSKSAPCSFANNLPVSIVSRCVAHLEDVTTGGLVNLSLTVKAPGAKATDKAQLTIHMSDLQLNRTLFVRLRSLLSFESNADPDAMRLIQAGAISAPPVQVRHAYLVLPVCPVFRITSVSDPVHGHAIPMPAPNGYKPSTTSALPGLPCFLAGGALFEEHRNYLSIDPATGDVVYPSTTEAGKITLASACLGSWVSGGHTPTAAYALPHEWLNTVILYFPDPGFEGEDVFTYEVSDGQPGLGLKATGTVNVQVGKATKNACLGWKCDSQTFDGRFNSLTDHLAGSMMSPLRRILPAAYGDGIDTPAGATRPSTRLISNVMFQQNDPTLSANGLSELHVHFGQFLTHDLDFATPLADYKADANFVIPIPKGDAWFDPEATGNATMRFRRTGPQVGTGGDTGVPREQLNKITAFLDLNVIYGTLNGRNRALRTLSGGRLLHVVGINGSVFNDAPRPSSPLSHGASHTDAASSMTDGYVEPEQHHGNNDEPEARVRVAAEAGEDCSSLVFSNNNTARRVCKWKRGQLEHLALNKAHLPNLNLLGRARDNLFVSGDNRVNVQPGLAAMHTLLAREHNTIADELVAAMSIHSHLADANSPVLQHARLPHGASYHKPAFPPLPVNPPVLLDLPGVSFQKPGIPYPVPVTYPYPFDGTPTALRAYDEMLFQTSRAIVRAKWQAVVWYEFLPTVLGPEEFARIPAYSGYKPNVDPSISNEFATAAFRFGHSQVSSVMHRYIPTGCSAPAGDISLRDAYFTAMRLLADGGVDPVIAGSLLHFAQEVDTKAVDEIRNLLFATNTQGFDLIALNIQRGRDHGLPHYNAVRDAVGLPRITSYSDISSNKEVVTHLQHLYGVDGLDNIDLVVGGLAEDHVSGGIVGPTFAALIRDVFVRVRDSDRFWFESNANPQFGLLTAIAPMQLYRDTRMADLLARNTATLDGRFGAEVVAWARNDAATNFSRVDRDSVSVNVADSLFYARPRAHTVLASVCAGNAESEVANILSSGLENLIDEENDVNAAYGF